MRCRCGRPARWVRSTPGRRAAAASSTSSGSWVGRPTSTHRPCTAGRRRSSPTAAAEEGYHFTEDMTDRAIAWVRQQHALTPDRPFFMYFAPGATHAPHHVPLEWADRYRGEFDDGWDALRERIFAEQKRRGVVPEDADADGAARRDPGLGRHARASSSRCWPGRWRSTRASWSTPTTTSDGSSTPWTAWGPWRTRSSSTSSATTARPPRGTSTAASTSTCSSTAPPTWRRPEFLAARMDQLGTPEAYNHFSVGWAHAMDTPYQWTKQVASHWGGTRNGTIVHWPHGHPACGRGAAPVPPRHRHRADRAGGGRPAGSRRT